MLDSFTSSYANTTGSSRSGDDNVDAFIAQYAPQAMRVSQRTGIAPELIIGQWGLETGWGRSVIPGTNNLGNIKDFSRSGSGVRATDNQTGSNDAYRVYASPDEFADDYAGLITTRYKSALNSGSDARRFATELRAGGYAEDPEYVNKLSGAVDKVRGRIALSDQPSTSTLSDQPMGPDARGVTEYDLPSAQSAKRIEQAGGPFMAGLKRGARQSLGLLGGGGALVADTFDMPYAKEKALNYYREKMNEAGQLGGDNASFSAAVEGKASLTDWAKDSAGYLTYQLVEAIGTGGLGGFVAKRLGKETLAATIKPAITKRAAEIIAQSGGKIAAETATTKAAQETAMKVGAAAALFTNNVRQEGGSIYGEAVDEAERTGGKVDLSRVWLASLAAAGIDTGAEWFAGKRLMGVGGRTGSYPVRVAKEGGAQGLVQGGTEAAQTMIERYGANQEVFSPEGVRDIVDSTAVGAFGGTAMAPVTGLHRAPEPPKPVATPTVQPNSPLTNATIAAGVHPQQQAASQQAAASPTGDPLFDRAGWLKTETGALLEQIRRSGGYGPQAVGDLLNALAVAQNPRLDRAVREQALTQAETFIDLFKNRPNFTMPAGGAQAGEAVGNSFAGNVPPQGTVPLIPEQPLSNTIDGQVTDVSNRLAGPAPAAQVGFDPTTRTNPPRALPAGPAPSAFVVDPAGVARPARVGGDVRDVAADAQRAAQVQDGIARRDAAMGMTPDVREAQRRNRLRSIEEAVGSGYVRIEGNALVNPASGERIALSSPADLAFARRRVETHQQAIAAAPPADVGRVGEIDAAAHEAATSPLNDLPEPTDAQKEAGNYKKGKTRIAGMDVTIENPKDSIRRAKADDADQWRVKMPAHYGYINRTEGADGDHVDLFIGPKGDNGTFYIIDQVKAGEQHFGKAVFDEHKAVTGVDSENEALDLYFDSFADRFGEQIFHGISGPFTADEFKAKLPSLKKARPVSAPVRAADDYGPRSSAGREWIKPEIEALIKRKGPSAQFGLRDRVDALVKQALDYMAGEDVRAGVFLSAAAKMRADRATAEIVLRIGEGIRKRREDVAQAVVERADSATPVAERQTGDAPEQAPDASTAEPDAAPAGTPVLPAEPRDAAERGRARRNAAENRDIAKDIFEAGGMTPGRADALVADPSKAQTVEDKVRAAFAALPSVVLGDAYPVRIEHDGKTALWLVRQDAIARGSRLGVLHLRQIREGRLVKGMPRTALVYALKLDSKNRLTEEAAPRKATAEERREWDLAFGLVDQAQLDAAAERRAQQARRNLARWEAKNPFMAMLAKWGIRPSLRADLGQEPKFNRMLPGGPLFRRGGLELDMLAEKALEDGFLSQSDIDNGGDNGGTRKLADMIQRALAGEGVARLGDKGVEFERRARDNYEAYIHGRADVLGIDQSTPFDDLVKAVVHADNDAQALVDGVSEIELERSGFNDLDDALRDRVADARLDDDFDPFAKGTTTYDGWTDDQILDHIFGPAERGAPAQVQAVEPAAASDGAQGVAQPESGQGGQADAVSQEGGKSALDLNAQTTDDQAVMNERARTSRAQRENAPSPSDDFILVGSDRAADHEARRHAQLFDAHDRTRDAEQVRRRQEALNEATSQAWSEDVRATRAKGRPKKAVPQNPIDAARADFDAAMADLADLLADKTGARKKLTADQEQRLLPVVTRLMDAAFRLGYLKFKAAAVYVMDAIRERLGDEIADHIEIDHLQGAYIGMATKYRDQGVNRKREVTAIESISDLYRPDEQSQQQPVELTIDDIPASFLRRKYVPIKVYVESEDEWAEVDMPVMDALSHLKDNLAQMRTLLDCVKGTAA